MNGREMNVLKNTTERKRSRDDTGRKEMIRNDAGRVEAEVLVNY